MDWVRWRESFLGRLLGFREWQSSFGFDNLPELQTQATKLISGGAVELTTKTSEKFNTFSEWLPFRQSLSLFELKFNSKMFKEIQFIRSVLIEQKMENTAAAVSQLSHRKAVEIRYENARTSTLVANVLFIREAIEIGPQEGLSNSELRVERLIDMAKSLEISNQSRSLQIYEIVAVQYNSTKALKNYLNIVNQQSDLNYWAPALSTTEGVVQRIVSHKIGEQGEDISHLNHVFKFINSFIAGWGAYGQRNVIFNIAASIIVKFPPALGREAVLCIMKMMF